MSFFKRKEKSVIPEPERPGAGSRQGSDYGAAAGQQSQQQGSSSGRFGSSKKSEPEPDGFERLPGRKYNREAPSYQPQQRAQPGGYGNYGDYQQQSQQPPAPMQQPSQQQGYGNYGNYGGIQDARQNLFANAKAPSANTGAAFDRYAGTSSGGRQGGASSYGRQGGGAAPDFGEDGEEEHGEQLSPQEQEQTEEDDEVEAIKQQIRFTKQESLSATRNAIRTARETEETATNTLQRLGQQTDRIANTELALDKSKGYNSRAADGAKEIKRLNQSIFKPQFNFNKSAKRDAEEQRILARHLEEKAEREEARQAAYESRQRVEQGFKEAEKSTKNRFGFSRNAGASSGEQEAPKTGRAKWEQGGRYQFEATNSDDELEQELDDNLDEIAGLTGRLKILATTAGAEIDAQNRHLDKVSGKVDTLDDKILMNTQYLKRIK